MPVKILCPVLPTDRFYDAVVGAADLVVERGGTITFLFTEARPRPDQGLDTTALAEIELDSSPGVDVDLDEWQVSMIDALDDARALLRERGVSSDQVNYVFADLDTPPAQSIAGEAAAGGYDYVVVSRGEMTELPDLPGAAPNEIAEAVETLREEGVRLMVT